MQKKYKVKLLRKENIAKNTWLFAFEKPQKYDFLPGQYQTVFLSLQNGRIDSRDMTITSSPFHNELWVVTKIRETDFKNELLHLPDGSYVMLQGPGGGFVLDESIRTPHVLLAGGIGITPFYSMLTYVAKKNLKIPLTLLVSFSSKEESIFYEELQEIAVHNKNIQVVYSLSNGDESWEGEKGRISEYFVKKYVKDIEKPIYMLAGSPQMVDDMYDMLINMGVDSKKIRIDYFTGY